MVDLVTHKTIRKFTKRKRFLHYLLLVFLNALLFVASKTDSLAQSDKTKIEKYSFSEETDEAKIDDDDGTIDIEVAYGTNLNGLIAKFSLSKKANAYVNGVYQESEVTPNDFTHPVIYTVVAEDGVNTQDWAVTVHIAPNTATDFLAYAFPEQTEPADIDTEHREIDIEVVYGTDVTNMVATFELSYGASAFVDGVRQFSGVTPNDFAREVEYRVVAEDVSERKDWKINVSMAPYPGTDIQSFSIPGQTDDPIIDAVNHTVAVEMPYGTDLTNLVSDFTLSPGAVASVDGVLQTSGVTSNDYSDPVVYSVTAYDGYTSQDWEIMVTYAPNTATDFLAYAFQEQTEPADIDTEHREIDIEVVYGTDVTNLVATFELSYGASAYVDGVRQLSGETPNDFTREVEYRVFAEDVGEHEDWKINVRMAPYPGTDIQFFSIPGQTDDPIIDAVNHNVTVEMPYGTDLTNLVSYFTLSPGAIASVDGVLQTSGVTSNDYSDPVVYSVTAYDGYTSQDWELTVTYAPNTATDILAYAFPEQTEPADIDTEHREIDIEVIYGTDVRNLLATFELSYGASAYVDGVRQLSGETPNDFTREVEYRVFAEDVGEHEDWKINVSMAPYPGTDIQSFSIPGQADDPIIDAVNHTIAVEMPYGTDLTNLVSYFTLSPGAIASVDGVLQTSGVTSNDYSDPVVYSVTAYDGITTQDWTISVLEMPNDQADILTYNLPEQVKEAIINPGDATVEIEVVFGTDLSNLVASFTLSPQATASIGGVEQISGITINDFAEPLVYVITAGDNSIKEWSVIINEASNTENDFVLFNLPGESRPSIIDTVNNTIDVELVYTTELENLIATFTLSPQAIADINGILQESGVTPNDFTNELTYTITAGDSSKVDWDVFVTVLPSNETDFITFSFDEQTGSAVIDRTNHSIDIEVHYGIDLTSLIASFTLSPLATAFIGTVEQESDVTVNDFSNMVIYTIHAGDNSTIQDWTVHVNNRPPSNETDILSFNFDDITGDPFIDTINHEVFVNVAEGRPVNNLVASFSLSPGATAFIDDIPQISDVSVNDFSDPVVYTIIAEDNVTTQTWTVYVSEAIDFFYVKQPLSFPMSSENIEISARIPEYEGIEKVELFYKKIEEHQWTIQEVYGTFGVYRVEIFKDMLGTSGLYYYLNAEDTIGRNIPLNCNHLVMHYDTVYPEIPNLRFGETVNQYQIISIPLNLQNSNAEAIFDELGEYDIKQWRLFHYNGISTTEYKAGFTNIDPGMGYWLIIRNPTNITSGQGHTCRIDSVDGFEIHLDPGWNQIGNPFDMDISWDNVIINNNNLNIGRVRLFNFDSLAESYVIPRYRGGFVFLEGIQPVTVNVRPDKISLNARKQPFVDTERYHSLDQPSWVAGLKITNGTVTNNLSGIGIHPEAGMGKDRHDEVLMPVPKEIIPFQLVFNHPEEKYNKFSRDVIPTTDQHIWNFEVKSFQPGQKLTISWDNKHFGENEFQLWLNHQGSETLINMREANVYSFISSESEQFRIIFGNEAFIRNGLKPQSITFGDGYPNPFRDELTIPFTLPESDSKYMVNISIYDLKGIMVKHLLNDNYRSGYYTVKWNSMEDLSVVSRGIYIIRMTVTSHDINTVITRLVLKQ